MKTYKRNLLVAALFVLGTFFNYANSKTILKNTKAVKVVFENVEKNHTLKIIDSEGVVLHTENVSTNGSLVKFFDFSSLDSGTYKIEVEKDFETLIKRFEVKGKQIFLNEIEEKVVFKPVVRTKDNTVLISRINFDKSPLNITVYYNDSVILEETISSNEKVINKVYKLDNNLKGAYKIVVSNNNKSTVKNLTL